MARFLHKSETTNGTVQSWERESAAIWGESHAALGEFLCCNYWEDGTPRQRGSLSVFCEDGVLKVCLNDRATERVAFVSGDALSDVLGSVEAKLRDGQLDWRNARQKNRK